jgi:hypothetical protein
VGGLDTPLVSGTKQGSLMGLNPYSVGPALTPGPYRHWTSESCYITDLGIMYSVLGENKAIFNSLSTKISLQLVPAYFLALFRERDSRISRMGLHAYWVLYGL